ncbi:hypothetical protein OESDEN_01447 [Oesophagostomum dentatum]|uniref:ATP-dependent DNA helicase n=1 Tax=Oesophagostomum dentatum TaxID=61180 RepID=A0A0B1TT30_OESDE|nr:hypothetical protein OESDEN_01447 [Oesophagostomum dentatum]
MTLQFAPAKALKEADFIIWDAAPMAPKQAIDAVDRLLQEVTQVDSPFGDKVMLLGEDFRQILPVACKGGRAEMIATCIKKSSLWQYLVIYRLKENMRVTASEFEWKQYLLELGNGMLPVDENDEMAVPSELLCIGLLKFSPYLSGRCSYLFSIVIFSPKNEDSLRISNSILERMPGEDIV